MVAALQVGDVAGVERHPCRQCHFRNPKTSDRPVAGHDLAHARAAGDVHTGGDQRVQLPVGQRHLRELLEGEEFDVQRTALGGQYGTIGGNRAATDHRHEAAGERVGAGIAEPTCGRDREVLARDTEPERSRQPGGDNDGVVARRQQRGRIADRGAGLHRDVAERRHEREVGVQHLVDETVLRDEPRHAAGPRSGLENVDRNTLLSQHRGSAETRGAPADHRDSPTRGRELRQLGHHAEAARPLDDRRLHRRDVDRPVEARARAAPHAVPVGAARAAATTARVRRHDHRGGPAVVGRLAVPRRHDEVRRRAVGRAHPLARLGLAVFAAGDLSGELGVAHEHGPLGRHRDPLL